MRYLEAMVNTIYELQVEELEAKANNTAKAKGKDNVS
jgi:hypothetical protein